MMSCYSAACVLKGLFVTKCDDSHCKPWLCNIVVCLTGSKECKWNPSGMIFFKKIYHWTSSSYWSKAMLLFKKGQLSCCFYFLFCITNGCFFLLWAEIKLWLTMLKLALCTYILTLNNKYWTREYLTLLSVNMFDLLSLPLADNTSVHWCKNNIHWRSNPLIFLCVY